MTCDHDSTSMCPGSKNRWHSKHSNIQNTIGPHTAFGAWALIIQLINIRNAVGPHTAFGAQVLIIENIRNTIDPHTAFDAWTLIIIVIRKIIINIRNTISLCTVLQLQCLGPKY